ncbi:WD40-like Beta Propeller Repeat [Nonlabens sp. Hel1_33_55]|uniref:TolB family protein n=1 Tax=Nonlabens sp. Hel1_33_55 TaxID=1336802 RepID=UPI000875C054|nr:PD40 domain-containing protein [Nonlabens sp. Hel1_33_55]SCY06918.1 WD40-like Beta Propeller Repeat [Nonlabens sp. Hel1_33_55]
MNKFNFALLLIILGFSSCKNDPTPYKVQYSNEPITTPVRFVPGVISTEDNSEFELTFSPDGRNTYFSRRKPEGKQKIYQSDFVDGKWTTPKLAPFSTDRDETPMITPDGKYLFFGSERAIPDQPNQGNFDMNIWMMEKTETGWSDPSPVPGPINSVQKEGEEWPSSNNNFLFTNDSETFQFTTMMRGDTAIRLYETKFDGNSFSTPQVVEGIWDDEKYWVYSAVISPDGNYLIFNSYGAPDGAGGEDIFVSKRFNNGWSKAQSIGPLVNTVNEESSPRFSRDGKYFFFSRAENLGNYEFGEWSIYYVETEYLKLNAL